MAAALQAPYLLQFPLRSPQLRFVLSGDFPVRFSALSSLHRGRAVSVKVKVRTLDVVRCLTKSTVEGLVDGEISGDDDTKIDPQEALTEAAQKEFSSASVGQRKAVAGDSLSLGIREPVYEVSRVISILIYIRILSFSL